MAKHWKLPSSYNLLPKKLYQIGMWPCVHLSITSLQKGNTRDLHFQYFLHVLCSRVLKIHFPRPAISPIMLSWKCCFFWCQVDCRQSSMHPRFPTLARRAGAGLNVLSPSLPKTAITDDLASEFGLNQQMRTHLEPGKHSSSADLSDCKQIRTEDRIELSPV